MNPIEQRVLAVLERKTTTIVKRKLGLTADDELRRAKQQERKAKAKALARAAARDNSTTRGGTEPDAIAELRDGEDCPICSRILDQIAAMDEPQRTQGIAQYGEFRVAIEDSEDAAAEALERNDVLREAVEGISGVEM